MSPEDAGAEFFQIWSREITDNSALPPGLSFILGVCCGTGRSGLWLFEYFGQFRPQQLPSWYVKGPDELSRNLETQINDGVADALQGNGIDLLDPREWVLLIGAAFDNAALAQQSHPTVRGRSANTLPGLP